MIKSKALSTVSGQNVIVMNIREDLSLKEILFENRKITSDTFFSPELSHLHDPFLLPDMDIAVERIIRAREDGERIVIFGDYDVDGVSSTAILVRFLKEIGCEISYRLPHRVHDGYGLKKYFFDELAEKNVKLVITVDCGTRDILPIQHAKILGIDVIVTDHHAVPDEIPSDVVALINPKRKDSKYPFSGLAGAGVAFKLLHGIVLEMKNKGLKYLKGNALKLGDPNSWIASCLAMTEEGQIEEKLREYIDLASLGTVADCMPLIDENRVITSLGLKQMKESQSSALRKYIENLDKDIEGDADVIGFQIGPRINAAGRMDSPLKALHWLLADESRVDDWLLEVENLNTKRQELVKKFSETALIETNTENGVIFYKHDELEHGIIGLIAGKLNEAYSRPVIVLCPHTDTPREKSTIPGESDTDEPYIKIPPENTEALLVASCRSPEWCNLVELLDACKEFFVRYGGHRQAAGFTIKASLLEEFQKTIEQKFREKYGTLENIPKKILSVESKLNVNTITLETFEVIESFRPFGIGNPKPLFYSENLTVTEVKILGTEKNHLSLVFHELPDVKCLIWNYREIVKELPNIGDILMPVYFLSKNIWKERVSLQLIIQALIKIEEPEDKKM